MYNYEKSRRWMYNPSIVVGEHSASKNVASVSPRAEGNHLKRSTSVYAPGSQDHISRANIDYHEHLYYPGPYVNPQGQGYGKISQGNVRASYTSSKFPIQQKQSQIVRSIPNKPVYYSEAELQHFNHNNGSQLADTCTESQGDAYRNKQYVHDRSTIHQLTLEGKPYLIRSTSGPPGNVEAQLQHCGIQRIHEKVALGSSKSAPSPLTSYQCQGMDMYYPRVTDVDTCSEGEDNISKYILHSSEYSDCGEKLDIVSHDEPLYQNVAQLNPEEYPDNSKGRFWTYSGRTKPAINLTRHASILDMQWQKQPPYGYISEEEILTPEMYASNVNPYVYYEHGLQPPYRPDVYKNNISVDSDIIRDVNVLNSSPKVPKSCSPDVSPTVNKKDSKLTREKSFLFPWERRKSDIDQIRKEKGYSPESSPKKEKRYTLLWDKQDKLESKRYGSDYSPEVSTGDFKISKKESRSKKNTKLKKGTKRSESEKYVDKSKHPYTAGLVCRSQNELAHKRSLSDDSGDIIFKSNGSPASSRTNFQEWSTEELRSIKSKDVEKRLANHQKIHTPIQKSLSQDSKDMSRNWCFVYWADGEGMKLGALTKEHHGKTEAGKKEKDRDSVIFTAKEKEIEKHGDSKVETSDLTGESIPKRVVVIHRDARGYGLTVSGESPVFVQSVKENGAAEKAGVKQGDRIIKVNGMLVANSNHVEVVKLIRSAPYVQLTLQAKPEPQNQVSPEKISGPSAVDKKKEKEFQTGKIATIRTFYEQVSEECGRLRIELQKNPNSNDIKSKLEEKTKMQKTLELQLFNLTGIPTESMYPSTIHHMGLPPPGGTPLGKGSGDLQHIQEENITGLPPHPPSSSPSAPKHRKTESVPDGSVFRQNNDLSDYDMQAIPRSLSESRKRSGEMSPLKEGLSEEEQEKYKMANLSMRRRIMMKKTASLPSSMHGPFDDSPSNSPAMSPSPKEAREAWAEGAIENVEEMTYGSPDTSTDHFLNMHPPNTPGVFHIPATQQAQVISMEDEEFSTDDEHLEDHGPFSDLNNLKHRPGHLAVFLYYLLSNSDPSPLLFYLITEQYTQGTQKDLKKWAYEIYSTFLHEKAPLKVNVTEEVLTHIDNTLQSKHEKEDSLKNIFQLARHMAQNDISEQLQDFRNKRALGLANLFGAQDLQDEVIDKQGELRIVEKILWPEFEKLSMDSQDQSERNQAIAMGLSTFFRIVGLSQGKTATAVERCSSFMLKEKKIFRVSRNKKGFNHRGHVFYLHQYIVATYCGHCTGLLWGAAGQQGWQCQNCDFNAHKVCLEKIKDECTKRKKDKDSNRKSMFEKFPGISRKPTNTNPAAIKEAQRLHDESHSLSSQSTVFSIRPGRDDDEDDLVDAAMRGENLLRMSSRTISLPSINHAGKRTSVYVSADTPPSTPVGKSMPKEHEQITGTDHVRNNSGRVQGIIQQFSDMTKSSDGSPSPRGKSPEQFDEDPKKKGIINIGRSESLNKKGEKRKSVRRTRSDVQVDEQTLKALDPSGSSSTSSLSNRSTESPSNSNDGINDSFHSHYSTPPPAKHTQYHDDSDFDVEVELPSLDKVIPKDLMKKLKPKDKKRQDVLNELFYTERNHCRGLKVMHRYFYVPMSSESWISKDLVKNLFPNLEELISVHGELNSAFKKLKAESPVIGNVAQLLIDRFKGESGDKFKVTCAKFCKNQSHALDILRYRMRKDQKLALFLQDASSNPACRRLQLQDIIPTSMQRLTKYPLLIDNLLKYTSSSTEEYTLLQEAHSCAKDVLAYVNQAVKDYENLHKLDELQKRIDKKQIENSTNALVAEYKKLDLLKHKLIHEGPLTWRINKQKQIDLHVVLLEDIVVLLQKQDDKLVLRCQNTMLVSGRDDTKFTHSPIINGKNLMVKQVATDKKGIFLVSTPSNAPPQIYELVANSTEEKKKWFKHFTDVAKLYEGKEGTKHPRKSVSSVSSGPTLPPPTGVPISESADHVSSLLQQDSSSKPTKSQSADDIGKIEQVAVLEENELIQPDEVTVSKGVVVQETPETLYDKLQQQEDIIQKAMGEKLRLMAEALQVPHEEFNHVAELASEDNAKNDPSQFLLASIHQSKRLTSLVNDNLKNTTIPSVQTHDSIENVPPPSPITPEQSDFKDPLSTSSDISILLPSKEIMSIANKLSDQLSQLMVILQKREEERVITQKQLTNLQDQVNTYRTQVSTSDTDTTPVTTPTTLTELPSSHHHTELHISEHDVSMQSSQLSTSPSCSVNNSRPVSFVSVNSEASNEQEDEDHPSGTEDDLAHTLTPFNQQESSPIQSEEASHSSSSTSSTNSFSTQEVKVQFSEVVVEKLQVLETENKFDMADKVEPLYDEGEKNEISSSSDTEKLEIVEEEKEELVNAEHKEDVECKENQITEEKPDESVVELKNDQTDSCGDIVQVNKVENCEADTTENVSKDKETSNEPIVISKETLVKNFEPTHMVTSETQTYETVAQVTQFTENIVAETIIDDENANIEYTPDIVPESFGTEVNEQGEENKEDNEIENSTSMCMEMDCQTEMDPELLAIIEAAEQIEAEQQYEDGFEDDQSQGDDSEEDSEDEDDDDDEQLGAASQNKEHLDNTEDTTSLEL